jgi:hypothetical protein
MKISNLFIVLEMYERNVLHVCIVGLIFDIEFFLAKNNFSLSLKNNLPLGKIKGKRVHIISINIHLFVHYLF